MEQPSSDDLTKFLIADFDHFGQSLWRNEEIGEKRFNFFLTLLTAVIAGLVALHTATGALEASTLVNVTNGALVGLLILGVLTYLRLLQRNRVTDQYQRTLKYIRGKLLELNQPSLEYTAPQPLRAGIWKWFRGGLAETVGAMEAVLLCALLIINSANIILAGVVSTALLIVFWALAAPRRGV